MKFGLVGMGRLGGARWFVGVALSLLGGGLLHAHIAFVSSVACLWYEEGQAITGGLFFPARL